MYTKLCKKCNSLKPVKEYRIHKKMKGGLRNSCKTCEKKYMQDYYLKNKDYIIAKTVKYCRFNPKKRKGFRLKREYGITIDDYDQMLEQQNDSCAICLQNEVNNRNKTRMCVDHCHKTGKVRGILCDKCNRGLGVFNDDINLLLKAIEYLKKNG